jgi:hypothetical protein
MKIIKFNVDLGQQNDFALIFVQNMLWLQNVLHNLTTTLNWSYRMVGQT